jgi:CBS domain-containing protein
MDAQTLRSPISSLNPSIPLCVESTATLVQAIEIMKKNRFGCILVVKNGGLVGIFTERDILKKIAHSEIDLNEVLIETVMTPVPEYLFSDDQIAYAVNRMHVGGFRHIPLIDLQGKPTGIISIRDILAFLVNNLMVSN